MKIDNIIDLLYNSEYLPIFDMADLPRIEKMFKNANIVISAWDDKMLVAISRSLCDFSYACYLSDICVHKNYRNLDIGKKLIEITKEQAGNECKLILHSNPDAIGFYEKIGMNRISDAFIIQRKY